MKPEIHPEYFQAKVSCACGNTFTTGATQKEIKVDICNACHPFYTGKQKFVDAAGRVERFQKKFGHEYFAKGKAAAPAAGQ
jgi:large subunit ribosomal protein L31